MKVKLIHQHGCDMNGNAFSFYYYQENPKEKVGERGCNQIDSFEFVRWRVVEVDKKELSEKDIERLMSN